MGNNHPSSRNMRRLVVAFKAECEEADLPCWLCRMAIDYTAEYDDWKNPSRFQLDHYYPASTHPQHYEDAANFRPSHAKCNQVRGNQPPRPPLGTPSRRWF